MRHLATLLLFILACAPAVPASAQAIARAADLRAEARAAQDAGVPLVIFFSEQGCPYCERARRDHLLPLAADPSARSRIRLVEVDIHSDAPLGAFAGARTTHSGFAAANGVKWVPTLIFVGANGSALEEPLIGLAVPELYQGLLERRVERALENMRRR